MNKIIIRKAKKGDLHLINLTSEMKELGAGYSKEYFKRIIKGKKGICLIAEHLGKIIGIVFGEFNKKENWAELTGIGVLKEYRRSKVGSTLLREFERIVIENNIV